MSVPNSNRQNHGENFLNVSIDVVSAGLLSAGKALGVQVAQGVAKRLTEG